MSLEDFADDGRDDELPAITLGDLRDSESVTLEINAEPETFESDNYGEGLRVEATFVESDYTFFDDDDNSIEAMDPVVLVSWSKRLARALVEYKVDHDGLVGETVSIIKSGTGMDVQYSVVEADN